MGSHLRLVYESRTIRKCLGERERRDDVDGGDDLYR